MHTYALFSVVTEPYVVFAVTASKCWISTAGGMRLKSRLVYFGWRPAMLPGFPAAVDIIINWYLMRHFAASWRVCGWIRAGGLLPAKTIDFSVFNFVVRNEETMCVSWYVWLCDSCFLEVWMIVKWGLRACLWELQDYFWRNFILLDLILIACKC